MTNSEQIIAILEAIREKYDIEIKLQSFNVTSLLGNRVGIGEHSDIIEEAEKLISKIDSAYSKATTISQLITAIKKENEE